MNQVGQVCAVVGQPWIYVLQISHLETKYKQQNKINDIYEITPYNPEENNYHRR